MTQWEDVGIVAILVIGVLLFFGLVFYCMEHKEQREELTYRKCIETHTPLECKR